MNHLVEMLSKSETLQKLPLPERTILLTLANTFQQDTQYLFLDPKELYEYSGIGTPEGWDNFLRLQETQNYIKTQMQFISTIAQRKTFQSLIHQALEGNHQAAKQVQEISGILNQVDQNKIIVLHYTPRPNQTKEETT